MAKGKVYLSPAYHRMNTCSIAGCDETTHNNLYLDELEVYLKACDIECKRGTRRVPNSNEDGNELMRQAVAESNAWGADIHYVSHTNASSNTVGGGTVRGCRPIIYTGSERGEKLAALMIKYRKEIYPYDIRLNRRTDLYELRVPYAVSFYEEHVFHDNPEDAQWFHDHMRDVAKSAAQGMCEHLGMTFVDPYATDGDCVPYADYAALQEQYNTLQASADAFRTAVLTALDDFERLARTEV